MNLSTFLKLIRWKNLLMIACIQILFKYVYFPTFSIATSLSHIDFFFLVLATVTIAAAGYIINDIYDIEADKINKPKKVFLVEKINIKLAFTFYHVLNIIGIISGFYIAYIVDRISFVAIFLITALLLKVYNTDLKKWPIIGNIIISLLVSLSILIVGVFDIIPSITLENGEDQFYAFEVLKDYALFAFMFMLIREIVKDIEDVEGDKILNMRTLPIVLGIKKTKHIVFFLSFLPLTLVTYYSFKNFIEVPFILAYMLIVVLLPLLHFMTKILYATSKEDYTYAGRLLKVIMLLG
ncbi:MAG: geranylgeranylglycerol-phosphate geranylgeranyltransferase, partial [Bacteroidia bacterium]|nr:geranylgeranylglycerol-phosphate geranylgeranyltransferase [Bacteroidia bacterium]